MFHQVPTPNSLELNSIKLGIIKKRDKIYKETETSLKKLHLKKNDLKFE